VLGLAHESHGHHLAVEFDLNLRMVLDFVAYVWLNNG
jgi:hypothetical protein